MTPSLTRNSDCLGHLALRDEMVVASLLNAFAKTEEDFLRLSVECKEFSGACANVVLIFRDTIYVANLGDCRAVLGRGKGRAIGLSRDHKASIEKSRIRKVGGFVKNGRVNGILAISRTIGDREFKDPVSLSSSSSAISPSSSNGSFAGQSPIALRPGQQIAQSPPSSRSNAGPSGSNALAASGGIHVPITRRVSSPNNLILRNVRDNAQSPVRSRSRPGNPLHLTTSSSAPSQTITSSSSGTSTPPHQRQLSNQDASLSLSRDSSPIPYSVASRERSGTSVGVSTLPSAAHSAAAALSAAEKKANKRRSAGPTIPSPHRAETVIASEPNLTESKPSTSVSASPAREGSPKPFKSTRKQKSSSAGSEGSESKSSQDPSSAASSVDCIPELKEAERDEDLEENANGKKIEGSASNDTPDPSNSSKAENQETTPSVEIDGNGKPIASVASNASKGSANSTSFSSSTSSSFDESPSDNAMTPSKSGKPLRKGELSSSSASSDDSEEGEMVVEGMYDVIECYDAESKQKKFGFRKTRPPKDPKYETATVVSAIPEITIMRRTAEDEWLFIASDGFYDLFTSKQTGVAVHRYLTRNGRERLAETVRDLCEEAYTLGSEDDITGIIIQLKPSPENTSSNNPIPSSPAPRSTAAAIAAP